MFFKAEIGLGFCGMDTVDYFEADSHEEAEIIARELAVDWAETYGFEQNEEVFGDLDSIGKDFDEESETYDLEGTLDYWVVRISKEEFEENNQ